MKEIPALAKALASDQMKIRKRAQYEVENILCGQTKNDTALPTYAEMLAICKGLHYTLWMQDKLLLKEEVVRRICHILPLIPHSNTRLYYINAMFETLAREWDRLDNWRVDKFMLLARDFFTQALRSLVPVDKEIWNHVLEAVFEKILNADIQHAIGLKMHMCTVLSEELSKKKVKAFCVVLTLVHLVSRLVELPKHHIYAHNFLRVIHNLLSTLRRHSNPDTTQLEAELTLLTAKRNSHSKSIRRISTIVRSIVEKKQRLNKAHIPKVTTPANATQTTTSESPITSSLSLDCAVSLTLSSQEDRRKRKKSLKKIKASKKLRLAEDPSEVIDSAQSIVDTCNVIDSNNDRTEILPAVESKSVNASFVSNNEIVEPPHTTLEHEEILQNSTTATDTVKECTPKTSCQTPVSTPVESVDRPQRRVSFGKVFRKRFIASQRLSMTPTIKLTPKKGILREQTQNGTRSRLSM